MYCYRGELNYCGGCYNRATSRNTFSEKWRSFMKPSLKAGLALFVAAFLSLTAYTQTKRPMTFDDLMAIKRIGDAQISPDGSRVAYVVADVDKNLNRGKRSVWAVPTSGGSP